MYVTASVDDFTAEHRAIEYFPAVHAENFIGLKWVNAAQKLKLKREIVHVKHNTLVLAQQVTHARQQLPVFVPCPPDDCTQFINL